MDSDTIAAIATPLGEGGIALVRLSGPRALALADACFTPGGRNGEPPSRQPTHTVRHGRIREGSRVLDEVLLTVFRAPRSFTREDVVEITCHGGLLPARLVLEALLRAGARLAHPGEFTRRAFVNGRIDLAQAEAVADLIHARTELAAAAAQEQLAGTLSARIERLRNDLMGLLAHLEAHIDFPEEDIAPDTREQMLGRLDAAMHSMEALLRTGREGEILRRGLRAAIIGRPNAGKSSLLNQLLGHDRAIVSPLPGTTRDTVQETAGIRGIPVVFVDTAGMRTASDPVEQEGVRRSREALARAELVLHVVDRSQPVSETGEEWLSGIPERKIITVLNKSDLPPAESTAPPPGAVAVSCLTGEGLEALKDAIRDRVWSGSVQLDAAPVLINARHQNALERAREAAGRSRAALAREETLEVVAMELRIAVQAVGEIVGKTATEDLLDSIFSQFCIGK